MALSVDGRPGCCFLAATLVLVVPAASATTALHKNGVAVDLQIEPRGDDAVDLTATFTPDKSELPLHLYAVDLQGTLGRPTRVELAPEEKASAAGPLKADQRASDVGGVSIYPPGPVTLHLPVKAPPGAGPDTPLKLLLTYMACTEKTCLMPVTREPVVITLSGELGAPAHPTAAPLHAGEPSADSAALRQIVAEEVTHALESNASMQSIRWRHPRDVTDLDELIDGAHHAGKLAILDFTGPSCVNCQLMAKSVFLLPEVRAAWNDAVPIEVDTDPPHDDFAQYQQKQYQTQNRPLYVVLSATGAAQRWNAAFEPENADLVRRFIVFLHGGPGNDAAPTPESLWQFLLLAVFGGLFTLVMPCTYPMIPFTLNVFAKQSLAGRPVLPLAASYAAGIMLAFTGLGVLVTGVFGASLSTLSGHPVTNLVVGLTFTLLGLSLLDVFFLRLPGSLTNAVGGYRAGAVGALVMGLTFAVTAFTCTAPFAGSVLAQGVATGRWGLPVLGMAVYSGTIAVPFFALGAAPSLIRRLPRADSWLNEFKVIGGLVEIGAAAKFLAISDAAWGWGIFRRGPVLALWAALAVVMALYTAGKLRMHYDKPVPGVGPGRLLFCVCLLTLTAWLVHGLAGGSLGFVESFFPADPPPGG